ncbi:MAG TPA: hypothetical protein VFA12_14795 [Stellaceae bacterium]|nr:hypothetical protein [Stellaceae bacterium]
MGAPAEAGGEATAAPGGAAPARDPAGPRGPRRPRPPRTGTSTAQRAPGADAAPREGRRRDGDRGERRRRDDGRRPGRGPGKPKPPQKLYTFDSVVDRGFDDVEEEAGTRRVHWTIVKRTVADQTTRKPMSATYVLQREGVDTEFPNLGAARGAVNKTIVHPEKLTMSKEEHAAAKSK